MAPAHKTARGAKARPAGAARPDADGDSAADARGDEPAAAAGGGSANEVHLIGRLAAAAVARPMPSGDVLATWRLIVARPATAHTSAGVDTIDCRTWSERGDPPVMEWEPGAVIEVRGALRRRFWRTPTGPASRYEVEVTAAWWLATMPGPTGGS